MKKPLKTLILSTLLTLTALPNAAALIGGEPALIPSSVYIHNAGCSGVLIAPHIIVTAGHCIDHRPHSAGLIKKDDQLTLTGYNGTYNKGTQRFSVKVVAAAAHPLWRAALMQTGARDPAADQPDVADLGVIVIDQQLPNAPATLPPLGALNRTKQLLQLTGSGCEAKGRLPSTALKEASVRVLEVEKTKVVLANQDLLRGAPLSGCSGDSGGGAYLQSTQAYVVAALVSTHPPTAPKPGEVAPTVLARLDTADAQDWLARFAQMPQPQAVAKDLLVQSFEEEVASYLGAGENLVNNSKLYRLFKEQPELSCRDDKALRSFAGRILSRGADRIDGQAALTKALSDFRKGSASCRKLQLSSQDPVF